MNKYKCLIFNKPAKTLCNSKNIKNKISINQYIKITQQNLLHIVGRLDYNSRGAMLVTNDGYLANQLMHPLLKIKKTYIVKIKGIPSINTINYIKDKQLDVLIIQLIGITRKKNAWIKIKLLAGKNKQLLNIFWNLKTPIIKIIRIAFADICVASVYQGNARLLTKKEIHKLYTQVIKY